MAVNLLTPILSTRTRSINFFNGRLLAGEDLTTEQQTNRVAHSLLGKAIGDGVVYGLEVTKSKQSSTTTAPVLAVSQGLAINKNGGTLLLDSDSEIALVRPATGSNGSGTANIFQDCTPPQGGTYIAGAGVYLLTVGPANQSQGLAPVSGLDNTQASCNSKYNVQGVQFRLLPILQNVTLPDQNHLRNFVAYQCFGVADQAGFLADPFGTELTSYGLMDQLRANNELTNCEVPLAVMYWTADFGIVFVDMWAVRRPVFPQAATEMWSPFAGRRRMAEGLAMFLQFQEQVSDMVESAAGGIALTSIAAKDYFQYLPAVGIIPLAGTASATGLSYQTFFAQRTYRDPTFIEGSVLESLVRRSYLYPPIDFGNQEAIWLYLVRGNVEAIAESTTPSPSSYLVFCSGHIPFAGNAHYDLNYWNYANYAQ